MFHRVQFGIEIDFTPVVGCQDVVDRHKKLFAKMALALQSRH